MWTHSCSTNGFYTKCDRTQPRRNAAEQWKKSKNHPVDRLNKIFSSVCLIQFSRTIVLNSFPNFYLLYGSKLSVCGDTSKIIVKVKLFNNSHTALLLKVHNWQKPLITTMFTLSKSGVLLTPNPTFSQPSKDTRGRDWSLKYKYCQPVIRGHWWPAQDAATLTSPRAVCLQACLFVHHASASLTEWVRFDIQTLTECWTCIMHAVCMHYPQGRDLHFATLELWVYQSVLPATLRTYLHTRKHQCAESPNSQTEYGLHSEA